jgi:hypothetical protein
MVQGNSGDDLAKKVEDLQKELNDLRQKINHASYLGGGAALGLFIVLGSLWRNWSSECCTRCRFEPC